MCILPYLPVKPHEPDTDCILFGVQRTMLTMRHCADSLVHSDADSGERFREKPRTGRKKRVSPDGRSASVESKPGKRQKPGPLSTPVATIRASSRCDCSQLLTTAGTTHNQNPSQKFDFEIWQTERFEIATFAGADCQWRAKIA
jgi:hypothetical protein